MQWEVVKQRSDSTQRGRSRTANGRVAQPDRPWAAREASTDTRPATRTGATASVFPALHRPAEQRRPLVWRRETHRSRHASRPHPVADDGKECGPKRVRVRRRRSERERPRRTPIGFVRRQRLPACRPCPRTAISGIGARRCRTRSRGSRNATAYRTPARSCGPGCRSRRTPLRARTGPCSSSPSARIAPRWCSRCPSRSKDHDRDATQEARAGRHWMDVGAGAWDRSGRPSEVRLDRVLQLRISDVRREGAALTEDLFREVYVAAQRMTGT